MSQTYSFIEMENRLKNRCFLLQPDALRLGETTCLQLALSSFASAKTSFVVVKDRFALANPRVVLAGCSSLPLAKVCLASAKVFFALANSRPSLSLVFLSALANCF